MAREEAEQASKLAYPYSNGVFTDGMRDCFINGAEWADQHPRKGLWDAEKVINFLKDRATLENSSNINIHINGATYHSVNDFIHDLRKAMED